MIDPTQHRLEIALIFDVTNGNPNGDPDAGNAPRFDPETGHGFVSDVCLKRKLRNFITLVKTRPDGTPEPGYDIYVKEKAILNHQHQRAYDAPALKDADPKADKVELARRWMCSTFFDIRMFGAVMTTGVNCGQVRGPVQFAFASSVSPISSQEQSVTRMAVTTEEESKKQDGGNRTMGRKTIVPYAAYVAHGFVNPFLAQQTGFTAADLELLLKGLEQMFETDRSAARGEMGTCQLLVFKHDTALGNQPARQLFKRLAVNRQGDKAARRFEDYAVTFDGQPLDEFIKPGESKPLGNGVTLIRRI